MIKCGICDEEFETHERQTAHRHEAHQSELNRTFLIADDGAGLLVVSGDFESTIEYIRHMIEPMRDGDGMEISVSRSDMTETELNGVPDQ